MSICGIDFSSFAVDIVLLDEDSDAATWHRFELHGDGAFDRSRSVTSSMPGPGHSFWDDILAVGIEEPCGHGAGRLMRIQGAILSRIPTDKLVHPIMPSAWRKQVGLSGNASKEDVEFHVRFSLWRPGADHSGRSYPPDYFDAYCIALATRSLLQQDTAA